MYFIAKETDKEVTLAEGLNYIQLHPDTKLYSDGLEHDEYIFWDKDRGFCYEDNCIIGGTFDRALHVLLSCKWPLTHKFYLTEIA